MRDTSDPKAYIGDLRLMKLFSGRPWWMWAFPLVTIAFLVAIPLFVWDATNAILNSTDGDFGEVVVDPSEPEYESYVIATPAHLTLGIDGKGDLSMVALISLGPNDIGGAVLLLNPSTVIGEGETIASIFDEGGQGETERYLREFLSIGFTTTNIMAPSNWASYVASVAPLQILLNDPLHEGSGINSVFPIESSCCPYQGSLSLELDEISGFLNWEATSSSGDLRRLRQEDFWRSWIGKLATEVDVSAVPGEVNAGIGRMVWGLSRGEMVVVNVPQDSTPEATYIDEDNLRNAVLDMVPFPMPSGPEARVTMRLLDGVGGLDLAGEFSSELVKAGAQIVIIGNASEYGRDTELIYHNSEDSEVVKVFKESLGTGTIYYEPLTDAAFDVTVIIGEDIRSSD